MTENFTIALAQANFIVGDVSGNVARIRALWQQAEAQNADLIVFPEMAITGYPVEDLALRRSFQNIAIEAVEELVDFSKSCKTEAIIGGIWREEDRPANSVFWIAQGKMVHTQHKVALPNYGVFDEKRIFKKGRKPPAIEWRGIRLGLLICEDMWHEQVAEHLAQQGARLLIAVNGSPYETGKMEQRVSVAHAIIRKHHIPLIYVNLVGGEDELVFDGRSFVMDRDGGYQVTLPHCQESLILTEWQREASGEVSCLTASHTPALSYEEIIYQVIVLGLRDYVGKSGFGGVVIALSGGVDSALTAAVAVDALGAEKVHTVFMPSPYTSPESTEDAQECARLLGTRLDTIPITDAMQVIEKSLAPVFAGKPADATEENIQARLRGNLLMAISNKMGWMVITTGNKSEMSVGYATLYGDMCGGYSVLKDIYKTTVFRLSHWRNANHPQNALGPKGPIMPLRVITKPPSAELRPDQKDEDSLPPYDVLDAILRDLIENQMSIAQVVQKGHDAATVKAVAKLLYRAEYKRRQAPPGVRVTAMSFGRDRRYPIVNKFTG